MEGLQDQQESGDAGESDRTDDMLRPEKSPRRKRRRSTGQRLLWVMFWPLLLIALVAAGGYFAIEAGYLDKPLRTAALRALDDAAGENYKVSLNRTVLRFSPRGHLVVEAQGVGLIPKDEETAVLGAQKARIEFNMASVFGGSPSVDDITLSGVSIDYSRLGAVGGALPARIDAFPALFEQVFTKVGEFSKAAKSANAKRFTLSGLQMTLPAMQGRTADVLVQAIVFEQTEDGSLALSGQVSVDGRVADISGNANAGEGGVEAIDFSVAGFNVSPFLSKWTREGDPHLGLYGLADLVVRMERPTARDPLPKMSFSVSLPEAAFYGEGAPANVRRGLLRGHYDFAAEKVEIEKSILEFPGALLPFSGGLIDGDRLHQEGIKNIAVELVIDQAISRTRSMQEAPISFSGKFLGDFDPATKKLTSDNIVINTSAGVLGGSLAVDFGKPNDPLYDGDSPEISLSVYSKSISTSAAKQLWPFWMGQAVREWAGQNLFGGAISDFSILLFLPAGRLPVYDDPVHFMENELKIDFAMERGRINIAGDIPPMRDTVGKLHYAGEKLDVEIDSGSAYFPSGRVVDLKGGSIKIDSVADPQLMTDVDMRIAGPADAAAELATYRPMQVMQRVGFEPGDFSGYVNAAISAHFPLKVQTQGEEKSDWTAQLALDNVAISKPIDGRQVSHISGQLSVNPRSAALDADLSVGGVPLQMSMVEPLVENSGIKRSRTLSGTLDQAELAKLVPGLDSLFGGQVKVDVELKDDDRQVVNADLKNAEVSVPWAGWTKGVGVPAAISFQTSKKGDDYLISDLKFTGSGFGATGALVSGPKGLVSADFTHVQLAPEDSLALSVRRTGRGYSLNLSGKSADLRGVLAKIKNGSGGKDDGLSDIKISAKLGTAIGFNNEVLKNVDLAYSSVAGKAPDISLNAVTGGEQAVVISTVDAAGGTPTIEISATDAGAFARFTGLYTYMYGGLLNQKLRYVQKGEWVGSVDVRRFDLINEKRFEELVTTKSGENGKSLNEAVRKNIDLNAQHFSRANALLSIKDGVVSVSRGILRGEQVGATIQGVVRDNDGNMNLTGTFMPAYGLNRLFAELPIIGILLGNGRDKGLIGITFKLSGPIQKPKLQINPLSIIAPGVFRNIFEFQ
ncbi:DUF3971 domain-containing protein [Rhizobium sp. L1K21]|uniref:DUF3971 domain-containing protein n=1 Tax=Rhizobium sp. L1K21 TaxID=2954933 RepID=UPI0020939049|nr:DUF3971 domain-containing protein [Rhizobium sp. L1K21]MCO6185904.1 DUF3971 domain-containing protein [Rhizobium sp. L1K21]